MSTHPFKTELSWNSQNRPFTYKEYSREYLVRIQGKPDFIGTAATDFLGSPYHYNPEDLLVASLSACHMLTYLAFAANSKIEVLAYQDCAEGQLVTENKLTKFKEVLLKPLITLPAKTNMELAKSLHEKAHHACFIANSVNFPVKINGEFLAK